MSAESEPHDYEPGERTDEMQTDPECRICGRPERALVHGLSGWGKPYAGPGIPNEPRRP